MRKEDIERLREEVDIVELVGEVVCSKAITTSACACSRQKTPSSTSLGAAAPLFGCGVSGESWVQERSSSPKPFVTSPSAPGWRLGLATGKAAFGDDPHETCAVAKRLKHLRLGADDAVGGRLRVPPARLEPAHHQHGTALAPDAQPGAKTPPTDAGR